MDAERKTAHFETQMGTQGQPKRPSSGQGGGSPAGYLSMPLELKAQFADNLTDLGRPEAHAAITNYRKSDPSVDAAIQQFPKLRDKVEGLSVAPGEPDPNRAAIVGVKYYGMHPDDAVAKVHPNATPGQAQWLKGLAVARDSDAGEGTIGSGFKKYDVDQSIRQAYGVQQIKAGTMSPEAAIEDLGLEDGGNKTALADKLRASANGG